MQGKQAAPSRFTRISEAASAVRDDLTENRVAEKRDPTQDRAASP